MLPRLKSVAGNLLVAAFAFLWPLFVLSTSAWGLLFFILWPIGAYHLWRAITLQVEPEFLPEDAATAEESAAAAEAPPVATTARPLIYGSRVRKENLQAFQTWAEVERPGWTDVSVRAFVAHMNRGFGERPWNGSSHQPIFARYLKDFEEQHGE